MPGRLACQPLGKVFARGGCETLAGGSIDKGVGVSRIPLLQPLPGVGNLRVRSQKNVARKRAEGGEAFFKILPDGGIGLVVREAEAVG